MGLQKMQESLYDLVSQLFRPETTCPCSDVTMTQRHKVGEVPGYMGTSPESLMELPEPPGPLETSEQV